EAAASSPAFRQPTPAEQPAPPNGEAPSGGDPKRSRIKTPSPVARPCGYRLVSDHAPGPAARAAETHATRPKLVALLYGQTEASRHRPPRHSPSGAAGQPGGEIAVHGVHDRVAGTRAPGL